MDSQFHCENKGRRKAVASPKDANGNPITPSLNGIDYLEVAAADQKTLRVYFLHNLPGQTNPVPPPPAPKLTKGNLLIQGGVRVKNIQVEKAIALKNVLTIKVNERGDFSRYRLRIVTSPTNLSPPDGFDPQLSAVEFSFKVGCPSEFDCKAATECPPARLLEPEINYLSKDYASFRRLMLDRLSVIMPDWQERNAADAQMALVELLAYVSDHQSYFQDAVATEVYLGTARKRVSVRRHARLLDYFMHDGCNARAWVYLEVEEGGAAENQALPGGTVLLTRGPDQTVVVPPDQLEKALGDQPVVFETMHDLTLKSAHNKISFYTWSDSECCLPRGSTRATLLNEPALSLKPNDVLILQEVLSPTTGVKADADPTHCHAVRLKRAEASTDPLNNTPVMEIEWHEQDALPFPLCLSALITLEGGNPELVDVSVARGNVVLADHGLTIPPEFLVPESVPEKGDYRPRLRRKDITSRAPYKHTQACKLSASKVLVQKPREALPVVRLSDGDETWIARHDLLGSDRFAAEFVVEMERDGTAHLRFGDDVLGRKPSAGSTLSAFYRIGDGRAGNIGAGAIGRLVWGVGGITRVNNPLTAAGGTDAETMEQVKQFAPQAFRIQQRAVTEADYAEVAQRHPEVQKAVATFRWTGSWYTVFVTIDRKEGLPVDTDADFKDEIREHLGRYRIAGYDLEINGPVFVPLDIVLMICVKQGYFSSDVKKSLLEVFSRHDLSNGQRGFFHPDNFTFGQPVFLSQVYKRAMEVAGVASVEVKRFQRWGKTPSKEKDNGFLKPAALEVVRLDNDPNFPENGRIGFEMSGSL